MRELLRRHRKVILALTLPYVLILFLLTYRIDYRIYTPGDLNPVENFIEFEESHPQKNPLHTIYIMNVEQPTFFQFMVSYFTDAHTIDKLPESRQNVSDRASFESGQVSRNTSVDLAVIAAYDALGLEVDYETEYIVSLYYDYMDNDELDIGDVILSVNDDEDVIDALNAVECEDKATLRVRKEDGEEATYEITKQERDDRCTFGLNVSTYYNIQDAEIPYTVKDSLIGGPSGGLMQTLYIYNALSEEDLTEDTVIAGTGSIRADGTVGSVGGVREKVWTAHKRDVDVFFVPEGTNHDAALEAEREIGGTGMTIVEVETFDDALEYLKGEGANGSN
ncbi:MAG: S16 family serine protease [Bacillota bacterium]